MESWRFVESTVIAFAKDSPYDNESEGFIQGAAQTTIRFKNWLVVELERSVTKLDNDILSTRVDLNSLLER